MIKILFLGSLTLEDAKNECLENPECTGITKDASSDYQLKNGTFLVSNPGVTTYMKSLIQWSSEYTGKILGGDNLGSFDTLEEAKNKCIVRLNRTKNTDFSDLIGHDSWDSQNSTIEFQPS